MHLKKCLLESCFIYKKRYIQKNNTDLAVRRVGFYSKLGQEFGITENISLLVFVHVDQWFSWDEFCCPWDILVVIAKEAEGGKLSVT